VPPASKSQSLKTLTTAAAKRGLSVGECDLRAATSAAPIALCRRVRVRKQSRTPETIRQENRSPGGSGLPRNHPAGPEHYCLGRDLPRPSLPRVGVSTRSPTCSITSRTSKGIEAHPFATSHPRSSAERLIDACASPEAKVCEHFHIPFRAAMTPCSKANGRALQRQPLQADHRAHPHRCPMRRSVRRDCGLSRRIEAQFRDMGPGGGESAFDLLTPRPTRRAPTPRRHWPRTGE